MAQIGEDARQLEERRRLLKRCGAALAAAAVTGLILINSEFSRPETIGDIGFTPTPPVSSAGTGTLISINDGLRNYGKYALGAGVVGFGIYGIARRRRDSRLRAMHAFTHQTSHWRQIALAGGIMGAIAAASGLGDTTADNASQPIREAAALFGADKAGTPVITSYAGALGNHMAIDYIRTERAVAEADGRAEPFIFELGDVKNPDSRNNPTSGPVVGISTDALARHGIDLPPIERCEEMSVLVGEQLGIPTGGTVTINGRPARVAGAIDVKPGLNRAIALGSVEQIEKCLYPDSRMAVANGLQLPQTKLIETLNAEHDTAYVARSFDELITSNQEFWDGNVKPSQMNLIFETLGVGAVALIFMQQMEIANRRKKIAVRKSRDVETKYLAISEFIKEQRNVVRALPVALGVSTLLVWMINSTQFGMSQGVGLASLGTGYLVTAAATAASSAISSRKIHKINVAEELRGSA